MTLHRRTVLVALGFAALLLVVVALPRFAGRAGGEAALERLQLVWPDYMEMPEADRAVIAGLAFQCGMDRVEKRADAVLACLQEAAASDDPNFPMDVTMDEGRERLAGLLSQAPYIAIPRLVTATISKTHDVDAVSVHVGDMSIDGDHAHAQAAFSGHVCHLALRRHQTANEYGWVVAQVQCEEPAE